MIQPFNLDVRARYNVSAHSGSLWAKNDFERLCMSIKAVNVVIGGECTIRNLDEICLGLCRFELLDSGFVSRCMRCRWVAWMFPAPFGRCAAFSSRRVDSHKHAMRA
jgi:hypothetical protein